MKAIPSLLRILPPPITRALVVRLSTSNEGVRKSQLPSIDVVNSNAVSARAGVVVAAAVAIVATERAALHLIPLLDPNLRTPIAPVVSARSP
jgi:hypothetical protein